MIKKIVSSEDLFARQLFETGGLFVILHNNKYKLAFV